ncbi:MAG TPA: tetratricopeptide repeat protein [Chitinophagaceae bacterium]|nr:tetratricopeptide repeat protein [Chitinophagaceae bacterium]
MKKGSLVLLLLLLFFLQAGTAAVAQSHPESFKLQEEGHAQLAKGNTDQAIILFSQAIRLDPQEVSLRRDLAYAHFVAGNTNKARNTIAPILTSSHADEQTFQIAAAIESSDNKSRRAARILRNGLDKFPYSGLLYHQQGILLSHQKSPKAALNAWQKGIEVAPNYALNYYYASLAYAENEQHTWAIIYGETYLNLDQDISRGLDVRKQIVESYKSVYLEDHPEALPDFETGKDLKSYSFSDVFQSIMLQNGGILRRGFDIETLIMLRARILLDWKSNYSIHYPSSLFHYHDRLMENGYFDVYNQWLFGAYLNSQEFSAWKQMNHKTFANFERWHYNNPLQLAQYDPKP